MTFTDPAAAEQAFYEAFGQLDIDAMKAVSVDSEESTCIHPGAALLQGTGPIIDSWQDIFRNTDPPEVECRLIQASADAQLAVHTVEERISSGDGRRHAIVVATNIYISLNGNWRMLSHHASLPLVETEKSPLPSRPPLH
jgi:hypothetical protein